MDKIISDYRRANARVPIGYWICTVFVTAGFFLSGVIFKTRLAIPSLILALFLMTVSVITTLDIAVKFPRKFKREFEMLPPDTQSSVSKQYLKAAKLGANRFMDDCFVYYSGRRIGLLRYDDILSVEDRGKDIGLTLRDGKTSALTVHAGENPAVIMAALRSKNDRIKFFINGKEVDFGKKNRNTHA